MNGRIREMTKRDARAVVELHRAGIDIGFLSSLGPGFLRQLYATIPSSPSGFGFVWEDEQGDVLGFIACAESTGNVYKQSLLRRGVLMAVPLLRFAFRPSTLKKIWETLRYPSELGEELPRAEVLSIVVSSSARGKGIGKALMKAAFKEFARREIDKVKVAVWGENVAANQFYRRCGYELMLMREHHGLPMSVYVASVEKSL